MTFKVSTAKSNSELVLALDLVCQVFFSRANVTQEIFRSHKELDWHNFEFFEKDSVVVAKDFNKVVGVIRIVYRVFHIEGEVYKTAGFTDAERLGMTNYLNNGFVDTFRHFYPDKVQYSWWSYRANSRANNKGWRIDYNIVSKSLLNKIEDASILQDVFHSDHCPVKLKLKI